MKGFQRQIGTFSLSKSGQVGWLHRWIYLHLIEQLQMIGSTGDRGGSGRLHWSSWPGCHLQVSSLRSGLHMALKIEMFLHGTEWGLKDLKHLWQLVRYTHHLGQPDHNCNFISGEVPRQLDQPAGERMDVLLDPLWHASCLWSWNNGTGWKCHS